MNRTKPVGGFAVIPYSLMNAIQDVDVWGVYSCVYRHGYNSEQGCWTSVKTLHEETGLSVKLVQRSLAWLVENHWLTAQVRTGYTTVYHVTPLTPVENDCTEPNRKRLASSSEIVGTPQSKSSVPPSRNRLTNKNPETRTQEQEPINQRRARASADADVEKKDPNRLKKLPPSSVPGDLSSCGELLIEYWSVKGGVRSTPVLNRICNTLRQWSSQDRKAALEAAISGGWANIYPPKRQGSYSPIQEPQHKHPAHRVFTADRGFDDQPTTNPVLKDFFA